MEENTVSVEAQVTDTAPVNMEDVATELSGGTEDVVTETAEETVVDNVVPGEETKEEIVEDNEFSAEEIDFDEVEKTEDGQYTVEGYNLDKFAEVLNFEDEDNRKIINAEMQKLKEKGYSQEQAEYFIEQQIRVMEEYEADIAPIAVTKTEVMKQLNEALTREEKANYKPILGWTKEVGEKIGLTPAQINEAMSNPMLVKLMNGFYQKAAKTGGVKTVEVKAPEPKVSLDYTTAFQRVQDKIIKGTPKEDVIKYAKELEASLKAEDLENFKTTYQRVFNLK
ncbi:MAG: hypothetical protein ACRDDH_09255 [Cetobacterium sp.]|uniref:hypothetical protein n=1 Tax=Cetobacterium sp. TaxID=2071632 RepID=UPI003EE69ED3